MVVILVLPMQGSDSGCNLMHTYLGVSSVELIMLTSDQRWGTFFISMATFPCEEPSGCLMLMVGVAPGLHRERPAGLNLAPLSDIPHS